MRLTLSSFGGLKEIATYAFPPRGPAYDPRRLRRKPVHALRGGSDALAVRFSWKADKVEVRVLAEGSCPPDDRDRAIEAARGIAALDDDPSEFFAMTRNDPILRPLARRFDPRMSRTPTLFEAFVVAVIEQLVTSDEARAAIRRLWASAGEAIEKTDFRAAPTASAVAAMPTWRLREIGIGSRRLTTLRNGARRGAALERLRTETPERMIEKIQSLPGVGPWTANHVAQSALGWADAVLVGDFHVPRLVTEALTGEAGGNEEMLEALEPYRPHRARVALLLMNAAISRRTSPRPRVDPHRREPWKY